MARPRKSNGQRKAPLNKKKTTITNVERSFDFLGLPLEIRNMVYNYLYIENKTQLAQKKSVSSKATFPHLSCSIHLVCKIITAEIDAFLRRQKRRISITLCHTVKPNYHKTIALLEKRLRCPTAGNILFVLPPRFDPAKRPAHFVRAVSGCLHTTRNAPLSVPNRELHIIFKRTPWSDHKYKVKFSIEPLDITVDEGLPRDSISEEMLLLGFRHNVSEDFDRVYSTFHLLCSELPELEGMTEY